MVCQSYSSQLVTLLTQVWTSENSVIDNLIKDTQLEAKDYYDKFLEWIPYKKLENFKEIGKGGFGCVYSATWLSGKREYNIHEEKITEYIYNDNCITVSNYRRKPVNLLGNK